MLLLVWNLNNAMETLLILISLPSLLRQLSINDNTSGEV